MITESTKQPVLLSEKFRVHHSKLPRNSTQSAPSSTHTLNGFSFILHLNENKAVLPIRNEYSCSRSNLIKGGKLYDNGETAHGERGFNAYQTTRLRDGCYLQLHQTIMPQGSYSLFHDWEKGASQLRRTFGLFAYKRKRRMNVNIESIIAAESKRISSEYGKSFLDCDDIVALTGLGRDNVRTLMKSKSFPVIQVGKRQVVSIVAFVTWQMSAYCEGDKGYGKY